MNSALACCGLFFALDLGRTGRGLVSWLLVGALSLAIGWNLVRLGRRLFAYGRGPALALELVTAAAAIAAVIAAALASSAAGAPWLAPTSAALAVIAIAAGVPLFRMESAALAAMRIPFD